MFDDHLYERFMCVLRPFLLGDNFKTPRSVRKQSGTLEVRKLKDQL
jgi:hypothetical protein